MKFRIVEGEHNICVSAPDEKIARFRKYTKGQIIQSLQDLTEQFVGKFERVFEDLAVANTEDYVGVDSPEDATAGTQLEEDVLQEAVDAKRSTLPESGWINATDKFPNAVAAEVTVWQNGNKFNVIDASETVLNTKPLLRMHVNRQITKLIP